jgi:hypothetical protein
MLCLLQSDSVDETLVRVSLRTEIGSISWRTTYIFLGKSEPKVVVVLQSRLLLKRGLELLICNELCPFQSLYDYPFHVKCFWGRKIILWIILRLISPRLSWESIVENPWNKEYYVVESSHTSSLILESWSK